ARLAHDQTVLHPFHAAYATYDLFHTLQLLRCVDHAIQLDDAVGSGDIDVQGLDAFICDQGSLDLRADPGVAGKLAGIAGTTDQLLRHLLRPFAQLFAQLAGLAAQVFRDPRGALAPVLSWRVVGTFRGCGVVS